MSGISLTASMRSNLLSLQNIARQQDIVQNRLATGLKVSSAIDNPSSYYTASSLNNRAADLTALLDAMSQGIQTIKAASEAIDSGTKFLEQAKAVAFSALETAIPAKEWFAEQVGENGVVVETAQELLDAVSSGKEIIVVYGKIELENQGINLKQGQKLVGTEYFAPQTASADGSRFSRITLSNTDLNASAGLRLDGNNLVSDLDFDFTLRGNLTSHAISAMRQNNYIQNISLKADVTQRTSQFSGICIEPGYGSELTLSGNINITSHSVSSAYAIYNFSGNLHIAADSNLNLCTKDLTFINYGRTYIASGAVLNLKGTTAIRSGSDQISNDCILNIASGVKIFAEADHVFYNIITAGRQSLINLDQGIEISFLNTQNNYTGSWLTQTAKSIATWGPFTEKQFNSDSHFIKLSSHFSGIPEKKAVTQNQDQKYTLILLQYNQLLADSFYKGINLLSGQNLKINFNENRSSKIEVAGVRADSESLGIKTTEWKNAEDIEQSISELEEAINSLRSFASAFGNYYSIVTTRQDFTENLINVLEEGTDKLTLADMNQESANMLALQTARQLAVNSLSLVSQASQSILRLF